MRKVIVNEFMSLDGVAQAPGGPDEDTSGGFRHGGWHMAHTEDAVFRDWVVGSIQEAGAFLLGRKTYEIFAAYWPNASPDEAVIADPLNQRPKHVVTRTLADPLAWQNASVLAGELSPAVQALKQADGGDVHVIGSTELARSLFAAGLVDELRVMIDPLLLGGGKRFLPDDGVLRPLRLADSRVAGTGAIIATYVPAGG